MRLPKGVERVRARGRTYYYWNPGRGTDRENERVPLPNADERPVDFWREVERRSADRRQFSRLDRSVNWSNAIAAVRSSNPSLVQRNQAMVSTSEGSAPRKRGACCVFEILRQPVS